jgi:carbonic anhydrase
MTAEGDGPFTFNAKTMSFHAPSEHTIEGEHFDLELQIFHRLSTNESYPRNTAIVSALFREGEPNEFLDGIVTDRGSIDLMHLFDTPTIDTFFAYSGSLTTPPCTENVNWYIHGTVFEASEG